jgi:hypothetical protein
MSKKSLTEQLAASSKSFQSGVKLAAQKSIETNEKLSKMVDAKAPAAKKIEKVSFLYSVFTVVASVALTFLDQVSVLGCLVLLTPAAIMVLSSVMEKKESKSEQPDKSKEVAEKASEQGSAEKK